MLTVHSNGLYLVDVKHCHWETSSLLVKGCHLEVDGGTALIKEARVIRNQWYGHKHYANRDPLYLDRYVKFNKIIEVYSNTIHKTDKHAELAYYKDELKSAKKYLERVKKRKSWFRWWHVHCAECEVGSWKIDIERVQKEIEEYKNETVD